MNDTSKMCYLPQVDAATLGETLDAWRASFPKLGICAFLPEANKEYVALLQAVCAQKEVPLVGAIFPALLLQGRFHTDGVWLLCFDEMPYHALYENLPTDAQGAELKSKEIAAQVIRQLKPNEEATLFMLFDAMVPNISTLLDHLYLNLANRVHYAGANAGSETFQPLPCLFDGQRIAQNGVLLMLLPKHKGAILEHGYRAPEQVVYATSTEGNRIAQIDWRPAFEVYQELVRAQYDVEITRENFYQHAVHFPFGIVRANHHVVVRIPVALNEDGSLFCVGEVPANSVLTLLERPSVDSRETLRVLNAGLNAMNGSSTDAELLLFYCAGRRMHLGEETATQELQEFNRCTGAAQVAGALSLGEIGGSTLHGYPLFHNATLVAARWQG